MQGVKIGIFASRKGTVLDVGHRPQIQDVQENRPTGLLFNPTCGL